jgi:beta-lactamase class D
MLQKFDSLKSLLTLCLCLMILPIVGQQIDTVNLKRYFGQFEGGFSLYDQSTNTYTKYNPTHCATGFSPCSTFKIANSLIGLQSGVIPDSGFVIKYDSARHPLDSIKLATEPFKHWYEDLSLKRAFKYSCVWYYQELARRVGKVRMKRMVDDLDYGNRDISSGVDTFWLSGSLQISIDEQVEFLKRLYSNQLNGISAKNINIVKSMMLCEATPAYHLYGKTGRGVCPNGKTIGWFVGFIETDSGTKIFAMNLLVNDAQDFKNDFRIALTKQILRELKVIQSNK